MERIVLSFLLLKHDYLLTALKHLIKLQQSYIIIVLHFRKCTCFTLIATMIRCLILFYKP